MQRSELRRFGASLFLAFSCTFAASAIEKPQHAELPNFDKRNNPQRANELEPGRKEAADRLRTRVPGLKIAFDDTTRSPKVIAAPGSFLSGPNGQGRAISRYDANLNRGPAAHKTIKAFLDEHAPLFGYDSAILDRARLLRDFTDTKTGLQSVTWQQELDGINVYEAVFVGHVTANGELVTLGGQFVPKPDLAANAGTPNRISLQAAPSLEVLRALALAAAEIGETAERDTITRTQDSQGSDKRQKFYIEGLPGEADARLVWLPLDENTLRLCWQIELTRRLGNERFRVLLDAATGEVLLRRQLTVYVADATFRVFTGDSPSPFSPAFSSPETNQPPLVARQLVTWSALNTNASLVGWIHENENETRGNNVDAHLDRNGDDQPDLPRPAGNPFRVFDFPLDFTQPPSSYGDAAVVQLFYWCNWMHDQLYDLGFTEAAGNFQKDNFGRGGVGGDAIQADAQDGSGVNNANFTPTADGDPGRIQMFVFTGSDPDRDGDFDGEVILHEYTHGLSSRLVGGGVGISALQTGGMGEGWSDFYAEALLSDAADDLNGTYPMGGYASRLFFGLEENYYFGIRRYPYTTDMSKNPLTFKDIDPNQADPHFGIPMSSVHLPFNPNFANEVHNAGEVWCVTLWEARANLIRKHGFSVGNHLILKLVTDGMKLSPPNPNFLEARDAIILADQVNNGGANWRELWTAFAKRGMGFRAASPSSSTTLGVVEAFDMPDPLVISPTTAVISSGAPGGPFEPACFTYTLTNYSQTSLRWTAQADQPWLTVTPASGTLSAEAGTAVTVCVNDAARSFGVGTPAATVTFSNATTGITQTRDAQLRISQVASMPFREDFEDVELAEYWLITGTGDHRAEVTSAHGPRDSYHLVLDASTGEFSRNEATLTLDLGGYTNVVLSFWAVGLGEEPDGPAPIPFINGADFDGVAVSGDGIRWYEVQSLQNVQPSYSQWTVNLDETIAAYGLRYNSQFRIRFNQFDNNPVPFDGIAFDDITVSGIASRRFRIITPERTTEGNGVLVGAGRVELFVPAQQEIRVQLQSSDPTKLTVPAQVVIAAGSTQAVFNLTVTDNALLDGTQPVIVSGNVPGFTGESSTIFVHDNETAILKVHVPQHATEGDGTLRRSGVVRASSKVSRDTVVELVSSDPNEVLVPASVVILQGEAAADFDITVVDDTRLDGTTRPSITARVRNWTSGSDVIEIRDNDQPTMQLVLPTEMNEGDGTVSDAGRVELAVTLKSNLVVSLTSGDLSELSVPPTVVVPAGANQATFPVTVLDDPDIDGVQSVTVSATAPLFGKATAVVRVLDSETPPAAYDPSPPHRASGVPLDANLTWRGGAGEIVINGGFETGDFTGWHIENSGYGTFFINDGTFDPEGPDNPLPPFGGKFSAITEQIGSGHHVLFQDVFIPLEAKSAVFTWADRIRNHAIQFIHSSQEFRVEVREPANNSVLATAYSTKPGDPFLNDWKERSFDLIGFRGRTVRLAFVEEDSLGYFNLHIDKVSVVLGAAAPTTFDVFFGRSPIPSAFDFQGTTSNGFWDLPELSLATTYYWQIVSRRGAARTDGPVWQFTTRRVGSADHFDWSAIASPQQLDQPFSVTITARDDLNNVATNFVGPVRIEGFRGPAVASAIVITEIDPGVNDAIEFMNVTSRRIDISGWQIAAYDSRTWPSPRTTFTVPTNNFCLPGEIFKLTLFGSAPGIFPNFVAGTNINWAPTAISNQIAVLLRDAQGTIVDFACAVDANPSRISSPLPIPASEWNGPPLGPPGAFTYQRVGTADHNSARDWVLTNATVGTLNLDISLLFTNSAPIAFSPKSASNFVAGRWTGEIVVHEPLSNILLMADDGRSHIGFSDRFAVGASNDLGITMSDSPDLTTLGDNVTYTINVTNSGPGVATGIVINDPLPAGLSFVSAVTTAGSCENNAGLIGCRIAQLDAGATVQIQIVATAMGAGSITNTATMTRAEPDAYGANNFASAETTVVLPRLLMAGIVNIVEGNSGTRDARVGLVLSPPCKLPVSVNYATSNSTATAGQDYIPAAGTVVFPPGSTEQSIAVTIIGDTLYEGLETVFVFLSSPTNAVLLNTLGRVRINEDDPVPLVSIDDVRVNESAPGTMTNAVFNVRLSAPSGLATAIFYATSNRTALAGRDYVRATGTLNFEPGVTNYTVVIDVIGDSLLESNEVFIVALSNIFNANIIKSVGTCTIVDNGLTDIERFAWDPIPSPQYANEPFTVTVTARDGRNSVVTGFSGRVALRAVILSEQRPVGTGTNSWEFPFATFYHDARTQIIYPASQLGGAGNINGLALDVIAPPAQVLSNWTIRLKHTSLSNYTRASWESGWTTVYARHEIVSDKGIATFFFDTPFAYNGQDNLMVDLSFNNSSYSADGLCRVTSNSEPRTVFFRTDSAFGNPLSWTGTNVPGTLSRLSPNLRLLIENTVPLSPAVSGDFVNGLWTGQLSILGAATNVVLRAVDANGHSGEANRIDVASSADMDSDGLPDAWERLYFGNLDRGPSDDPDGDGLSNLQEFKGGTNPSEGASALQITALEQTAAGLRISFNTVAAHRYQLERTDNIIAGQWQPVGVPQAGTGAPGQVIDPEGFAPGQYFYRLRVLP